MMMTMHPLSRQPLLAGLKGLILTAPLHATEEPGETLPRIAVTKDASCGCCAAWADHVRAAGFPVEVTEASVNPLKIRLGVPRALAS